MTENILNDMIKIKQIGKLYKVELKERDDNQPEVYVCKIHVNHIELSDILFIWTTKIGIALNQGSPDRFNKTWNFVDEDQTYKNIQRILDRRLSNYTGRMDKQSGWYYLNA